MATIPVVLLTEHKSGQSGIGCEQAVSSDGRCIRLLLREPGNMSNRRINGLRHKRLRDLLRPECGCPICDILEAIHGPGIEVGNTVVFIENVERPTPGRADRSDHVRSNRSDQ